MLNAIAIVFIIVFALEAAVIIIGNVFTIYIFWTMRFRLKRTCLLLIHLAVIDLLNGIAEAVALVIHRIPRTEIRPEETRSPMWVFQAFGSCTSVMFLALISLERVYAVLWPLRHRVTNTRPYIYSIVTVWVAGLCIAGLSLLTVYHSQVETMYGTVAIDSFIFISLVVICASYLSIRSRLHRTKPELQVRHERSTEQNLRLSKTFYIVVAVSLLLWLPAFLVYTIKEFCCQRFSPTVLSLVTVLHLANSMVNPFIYSFRMAIFKDALRRCWRKRQQNIAQRAVSLDVYSVSQRGEFITTHL
ncbi:sphingosine 1-phosphate receptor 1-like [Oculina patagonica]